MIMKPTNQQNRSRLAMFIVRKANEDLRSGYALSPMLFWLCGGCDEVHAVKSPDGTTDALARGARALTLAAYEGASPIVAIGIAGEGECVDVVNGAEGKIKHAVLLRVESCDGFSSTWIGDTAKPFGQSRSAAWTLTNDDEVRVVDSEAEGLFHENIINSECNSFGGSA